MDPNETLKEIREQVATALLSHTADPSLVELAEAVDALDDWLSKGGFLPTPWAGMSGVSKDTF